MTDRRSNRDQKQSSHSTRSSQSGQNSTGRGEEKDAGRFTGDGKGARGYRANPEYDEADLWRDAYGAYGFSRGDDYATYPAAVAPRSGDRNSMSGYGAQGFGVGEQRGSQWGGGARGGYGGGLPGRDSADPNDPRATRGRAWGERGRPRRETP